MMLLEKMYFGNSLQTWLIAFSAVIAAFLVLIIA